VAAAADAIALVAEQLEAVRSLATSPTAPVAAMMAAFNLAAHTARISLSWSRQPNHAYLAVEDIGKLTRGGAGEAAWLRANALQALTWLPQLARVVRGTDSDTLALMPDDAITSRIAEFAAAAAPSSSSGGPWSTAGLHALDELAGSIPSHTGFHDVTTRLRASSEATVAGKSGVASLRALQGCSEFISLQQASASSANNEYVEDVISTKLALFRKPFVKPFDPLPTDIKKIAALCPELARACSLRSVLGDRLKGVLFAASEHHSLHETPGIPQTLLDGLLLGNVPDQFGQYADLAHSYHPAEYDRFCKSMRESNSAIFAGVQAGNCLDLLAKVAGPLFGVLGYDGFLQFIESCKDCMRAVAALPSLATHAVAVFTAGFKDASDGARHSMDSILPETKFVASFGGYHFSTTLAEFEAARAMAISVARFQSILAPLIQPPTPASPAATVVGGTFQTPPSAPQPKPPLASAPATPVAGGKRPNTRGNSLLPDGAPFVEHDTRGGMVRVGCAAFSTANYERLTSSSAGCPVRLILPAMCGSATSPEDCQTLRASLCACPQARGHAHLKDTHHKHPGERLATIVEKWFDPPRSGWSDSTPPRPQRPSRKAAKADDVEQPFGRPRRK
jgi:hypothetical protein